MTSVIPQTEAAIAAVVAARLEGGNYILDNQVKLRREVWQDGKLTFIQGKEYCGKTWGIFFEPNHDRTSPP